MAYSYSAQRPFVFTEEGQVMFLKVRDRAKVLLAEAGVVRCDKLMAAAGAGVNWDMLACVDRLVELGELVEIATGGPGQYRVFREPYTV